MQRIGANDAIFWCNHITYMFKVIENVPSLYSCV